MIIGILPDPETHHLWKGIYRLLATAAERSGSVVWTPEFSVWVIIDAGQIIAAATTRLVEGGEAELWHIAGTRVREWLPELDRLICEWATANDATRITCQGRAGWKRLSQGYRPYRERNGVTYYEKVLK